MRQMLVIALVLLLSCLSLGQTKEKKERAKPGSGGSVEQAVERLDDEVLEAAKKGDTAFFGKTLADDYIRIGSNGQMNTKAETVQIYKSGELRAGTIELKNRKVRVFGNTAIVTREVEEKGQAYRSTLVFVKMKNGQWQLVTFQATKEQQPPRNSRRNAGNTPHSCDASHNGLCRPSLGRCGVMAETAAEANGYSQGPGIGNTSQVH